MSVQIPKHYKETSISKPNAIGAGIAGSARTATNYITDINNAGITVHPVGGTTSRLQINASGTTIYQNNVDVASYGASTRIGKSDKSHTVIDYHSMQLIDKEGSTYFYVSDLRDENGEAELTETFTGDGQTRQFYVSFPRSADVSATDSSDQYNEYSISGQVSYIFENAPADGAIVTIVYKTQSDNVKAYTLGRRNANSTIGAYSYALGDYISASGRYAHAEGYRTTATGNYSHVEGSFSTASGRYAHAEGSDTIASNDFSHAEGTTTEASGKASHAEGCYTTASGNWSHSQGYLTKAASLYQTVIGIHNVEDANNKYAFIIGNGTNTTASNALAVRWNGSVDAGRYLNLYDSDQTESAIGQIPSANQYHGDVNSYDSSGERDFYSQTAHTTSDNLYRSFVVRRLNDNIAITNGFYIGIDASGNSYVNFTSGGDEAWRSGLGLGSLATKSSLAAGDIPNLSVSKVPGIRRGVVGQTNTVAAGSYKDISVSFGHTYGSNPTVIVGLNSSSTSPHLGSISVAVASVNTTGFTARLFNNSSSDRAPGFYWIAVG